MIPGSRASHNNFTPLRLGLALAVVIGHFRLLAGDYVPPFPFNLADAAVFSFFIVSGYLITQSFERDGGLLPFYIRRVFRLYPMYIAVVLLQALIMMAVQPGGILANPGSTLRYLLANALFANFLQYDIGGVLAGLPNPGINPSLWTLKIEMGFYLIVPLIVVAYRAWRWPVLVLLFVGSVGFALLAQAHGDARLAKQLPGQLQYFVVGIWLYYFAGRIRLAGWAAALVGVGYLVFWNLWQPLPPVITPLFTGAAVFAIALRTPHLPLRKDISYGVYLLHGPLIQLTLLVGLYTGTLLQLAMLVGAVILLALLGEFLVERPGIAIGKRLSLRVAALRTSKPAHGLG